MILIDLHVLKGSGTHLITLQVEHLISIEPRDDKNCIIRTTGGTLFELGMSRLEVVNKLLELNKTPVQSKPMDGTVLNPLPTQVPTQRIEVVMNENHIVFTRAQIILFIITMVGLVVTLFFTYYKNCT